MLVASRDPGRNHSSPQQEQIRYVLWYILENPLEASAESTCLPWHFQQEQTHAKLNAFLWPELGQEWQLPLILLHWVRTVISWPHSDVNLLTERAGRWHKSSFLFHLQFVHCRVKKGMPGIKRRPETFVSHLTPGVCNEADGADLPLQHLCRVI